MSSKLGSEPLGKFYTGRKPKKRREWRGIKDTWYDYVRWLGYWKTLITFIVISVSLAVINVWIVMVLIMVCSLSFILCFSQKDEEYRFTGPTVSTSST